MTSAERTATNIPPGSDKDLRLNVSAPENGLPTPATADLLNGCDVFASGSSRPWIRGTCGRCLTKMYVGADGQVSRHTTRSNKSAITNLGRSECRAQYQDQCRP